MNANDYVALAGWVYENEDYSTQMAEWKGRRLNLTVEKLIEIAQEIINTFEKIMTQEHFEMNPEDATDYSSDEDKYEMDDKGVMCRYSEEQGWEPIEPHCVECGYKNEECECDDL